MRVGTQPLTRKRSTGETQHTVPDLGDRKVLYKLPSPEAIKITATPNKVRIGRPTFILVNKEKR